MRMSITILDTTAVGQSVYSRLPNHFQREVGELLSAIFGSVDAYKIRRFEISIYAASPPPHGGAETLQWCALDLHKDGDLQLDWCGPSARMCVFGCVWVRVRA